MFGFFTLYELRDSVNAAMIDGWEPLGGVSVTSQTRIDPITRNPTETKQSMYFAQAMLKGVEMADSTMKIWTYTVYTLHRIHKIQATNFTLGEFLTEFYLEDEVVATIKNEVLEAILRGEDR